MCLAVCLALILRLHRITFWIDLQPKPFQRILYGAVNIVFGLIIGWSWVFWHSFLMPSIPENVLNQPVFLTGTIIDLPNQELTVNRVRIKYLIQVDSITTSPPYISHSKLKVPTLLESSTSNPHYILQYPVGLKPTVVINWYLPRSQFDNLKQSPQMGETWQMRVKLKANHASMNPGAFDYETWLFQQGISAKGYVKSYSKNDSKSFSKTEMNLLNAEVVKQLEPVSLFSLMHWRSWLAKQLKVIFSQSEFSQFYQALTFGEKSTVSPDDWALLQNTGTIHLMAISGLHMGIVALLGFWCFKGLWWLGVYRVESINLPSFAALGALLFASLYLMISGFSIPTQRAWLMVVAVLVFIVARRSFQPWSALALAALMIVLWDSKAVLSFGFWLSFIAVSLIFAALITPKSITEVGQASSWRTKITTVVWLQFILTLGLAPLLIWLFNSLPIYSFVANLIAVPFISLIGLPLLFFSSIAGLFSLELGQWFISVLDTLWHPFWQYLLWLNQLPNSRLSVSGLSPMWLIIIYAFLFIGLRLKFNLQRGLVLSGVILLITVLLFSAQPQRPALNEAKLTVLDVGQGQAIVIETHQNVVVYDTGAKWGDSMDGAKLAVLPYLKLQGWNRVDRLIVSHSDSDHAGGVLSLVNALPVSFALSGQPRLLNNLIKSSTKQTDSKIHVNFTQCQTGTSWQLDGVLFEILSPQLKHIGSKLKSDNDLSCVLSITTGIETLNPQRVIITGDLSSRGEKILLKAQYQAQLLIAGHHGSNSSTSKPWLAMLKPEKIIFSSGYLNRFKFPSKKVLARIESYNAVQSKQQTEQGGIKRSDHWQKNRPVQWWNTACSGALSFQLTPTQIKLLQENRKSRRKWYHHRCKETQRGHLFQ
ncbi:MAG: competence protein ComEC [Thiomicrorhabdus sp.]|nr:MAG: competence protein ComEC [Thiomicrorhabdus sp.]